ncbi:MAG: I78 family peptidase inhibitor [Pseudoxanthomonas sp.]
MSRPSMFSALVLSLVLSACAQVPSFEAAVVPPQPVTDPASPSHCDAGKASNAIGQLPLAEVVEAARNAAGAEVVRTLRQGQPITKEFRVGRLNLVLDAEGRIGSANCS